MNSSNGSNDSNGAKRQRRHFADPDKVAILKRHLVDKVPVSDLCDEFDIYPNQFYDWLKKFFENGHRAFAGDRKAKAVEDAHKAKIDQLEAKLTRKNEVMAELMEALTEKKKAWGALNKCWVPHDTRDRVVDFVRAWSDKTDFPVARFMPWIGIARSKYHDWIQRFGKVNEHNAWVPRDHWLTPDENERICQFARQHPLEGYRRLAFMMIDDDVAACSPASVYRVLKKAGLLSGQTPNATKKGTGYVQPLKAHQEWHVDVSYLNIAGTFYFLCSILDGYSRFITHWEIREKMEEIDVETILQRAREKFPGVTPRIISDNGPQFISKDFKEFIRIAGMTHVRTSPYYPQSNGKIERWHKTLKGDCIRVQVPLSLEEARRIVGDYVGHYNKVRLHSAVGYVAPKDKLLGNDAAIHARRDQKLAEARERRKQMRHARREGNATRTDAPSTVPPRPAIDFAAVRTAFTIAQVLALLGFTPRSDRAGQQRGPCPLHGGNGAANCFSVNTGAHTFHCFKCNRSGNALDLWAAANRLSIYDAAIDLCLRLNLPLPTLTPNTMPTPSCPTTPPNREEEPVADDSSTCTIP